MQVDRDEFLAEAVKRHRGEFRSLTIRELLRLWGAERRGYRVVDRIKRDLDELGLVTIPDFEDGWIDNEITLAPISEIVTSRDQGPGESLKDQAEPGGRPPEV